MKASELIEYLKKGIENFGDMPVVFKDNGYDQEIAGGVVLPNNKDEEVILLCNIDDLVEHNQPA